MNSPALMQKDGAGVSIQSPTGIQCSDGTTSPVTSPITAATSTIQLIFPTNAFGLWIYAETQNVGVSDQGLSNSVNLFKNVWFRVPGKPGDKINITRGSSTIVDFYFETLG